MDTLIDLVKNPKTTLIDIREGFELSMEGSIEHAQHIPMGEIADKLDELQNLPGPIVLFCKSGGRAGKVQKYLEENGLTEVYNGGGYKDINQILNS